jgi:carbon storage regulator
VDKDTGRLVIRRRPGEVVLIGDDVRVTVLERSSPGSVRLSIEAPRDVLVLREEVRRDA